MVQCVHDIKAHRDNDLTGDLLVSTLRGKACHNPLAACWAGTLDVGYLIPCTQEPHVYTHKHASGT